MGAVSYLLVANDRQGVVFGIVELVELVWGIGFRRWGLELRV